MSRPSIADQPGSAGLVISSFRDALGLAMLLADEYAFVNAAAVLDSAGTVTTIGVADGVGQNIERLVGWCATRAAPGLSEVLLLTVRPYESDVITERDLGLYRHARWSLAGAGIGLADWIETDGDLFRSYAYVTCPAHAWPRDPPQDRIRDADP